MRNDDLKILLISYGDVDYDGRLRGLITAFGGVGKVFSFTRGSRLISAEGNLCNKAYSIFIIEAIRFASKLKPFDMLVIDNRKATIPGLIIRKKYRPKHTVQDCRELYLYRETNHFTGKVGCIFEKAMAKKADIVICANKERAEIMQREYSLANTPLTYENLRKLEYSSEEGYRNAKERIDAFINDDEITIVSSSGCSISRTNDILVKNLKNVKWKCNLFLVGSSEAADVQVIKKLANEDKNNTITILGQLNQDELKYLISKCQIGIVNYGQYDTNNRLCASGKIYEFLYEGKPVVTTTNPPLKNMCDLEHIGIADDQYTEGINEVIENYGEFKKAVEDFAQKHSVKENNTELAKKIRELINATK